MTSHSASIDEAVRASFEGLARSFTSVGHGMLLLSPFRLAVMFPEDDLLVLLLALERLRLWVSVGILSLLNFAEESREAVKDGEGRAWWA